MPRISLVEQYNNKDVIAQVYNIKDELGGLVESVDSAYGLATTASVTATSAMEISQNAQQQVNQLNTRTEVLETNVGASTDPASGTGSLYARTKQNASDISSQGTTIGSIQNTVGNHTTQLTSIQNTVDAIPSTYQSRAEKGVANGYAGLNAYGMLDTSKIDTGVSLNQVLKAGAQLNTGEVLYIGPNGTIRSRIIGEGV